MRVVFDPNVLISALISSEGPPREIINLWVQGRFDLVMSPKLLGEMRDVLNRPKFRRWVDIDVVADYLQGLSEAAILVEDPPTDPGPITPDPDDDYLVVLARSADADLLVSGDSDLISLSNPIPPVLTPRQFRERVSG